MVLNIKGRRSIFAATLCLLQVSISGCGKGKALEPLPKKPKSDPATPDLPESPPVKPEDPAQKNHDPVVILLPLANTHSSLSELVISGSCTTGLTVTLGGAVILSEVLEPLGSLSQTCLNSTYSYTISKIMDGTYPLTIIEVGKTPDTDESKAEVVWTRDTVSPLPISIAQPAGGVVRNSSNSLVIAGACESGTKVSFAGESNSDVVCVGGFFSTEFFAAVDGVQTWFVSQTDLAGNNSPDVSVQWTKDSSLPEIPVIVTPIMNSYSSNPSVVISGTCHSGFKVDLAGAITANEVTIPTGLRDQVCGSGVFSFTVQKSADGSYDFSVSQTDPETDVTSAPAVVTWNLDTLAPASVVISQPVGGSLTTADSTFTMAGSCEPTAAVSWVDLWTVSGSQNQPSRGAVECSVQGTFQVVMNAVVDGVYTWNILQTDRAQSSSTSVPVVWTRDSTIPATPIITTPATGTVTTSQSALTIFGTCVTGNLVTIGGNVESGDMLSPVGELTYQCAQSSFSFTVSKIVDASFSFAIFQTNAAKTDSPSALLTWVRDTVAPAAVVLTSPSGSSVISAGDIVVAGECETGAPVSISGAVPKSVACANGLFSTSVSSVSDGNFSMEVIQTDGAQNTSSPSVFTWTRNSIGPSTPVIVVPSTSPYTSSSMVLTIQGSCTAGLLVELSGVSANQVTSPSGSLGQTCSPSHTFEWTLTVSSDATYPLSMIQWNNVGASAPAQLIWVVDSTAPPLTLVSTPANPTLALASVFTFSSTEGTATFRCALDGAVETACVSPLTYSNLVNGVHTFSVKAVDLVGNVSADLTYSWTVNARKTIALYHFDTAPGHLIDSSGYLPPYTSGLVAVGAPASGAGKFGQADVFTATAYLDSSHNASTQNLPNSTMTVEAFVKIASVPRSYYTIASKGDVANNFGWKFQIKKSGTSGKILTFNVSTNGTTWGKEVVSATCSLSTSAFSHIAVTWNKGTVNFFCAGVNKGTKIIGTAGSTIIYPSTAPLYVGSLAGSVNALATIDELRVSQVLRYTSAFTSPAAAFVGD